MQGDVRYPLFKVYEEGRRVRGKEKRWSGTYVFHSTKGSLSGIRALLSLSLEKRAFSLSLSYSTLNEFIGSTAAQKKTIPPFANDESPAGQQFIISLID